METIIYEILEPQTGIRMETITYDTLATDRNQNGNSHIRDLSHRQELKWKLSHTRYLRHGQELEWKLSHTRFEPHTGIRMETITYDT